MAISREIEANDAVSEVLRAYLNMAWLFSISDWAASHRCHWLNLPRSMPECLMETLRFSEDVLGKSAGLL